jgi:hypothetical protein
MNLKALEKADLLICCDCSEYKVNDEYSHSTKHVNVDFIFSEETLKKSNLNNIYKWIALLNKDHEMVIEAAIIKLMKQVKSLDLKTVVLKIQSQLEMYQPKYNLIKDKIDKLISQEYLEKDDKNNEILNYK